MKHITYRTHGHFEGDNQAYKSEADKEKWPVDVDCIEKFKDYAIQNDLLSEEELTEIERASEQAVQEAVEFAHNSKEPSPETLTENVYVAY